METIFFQNTAANNAKNYFLTDSILLFEDRLVSINGYNTFDNDLSFLIKARI